MKENLDLIDAYLNGNLETNEMLDFDDRLKSDPEFQLEFQEAKLIKNILREEVKLKVLQSLKNQEASIEKSQTIKTHTTMKKYISIAATLLLIVSLSYFGLFSGTSEVNGAKIFGQYYEAYTNIASGIERGTAVDLTNLKNRAYYAYDLGNYEEAERGLAQLVETDKSADNYFYLGIAHIETGDTEAAKNDLNIVLNNYSKYAEQAQWYLALTLLKDGATDEALSNLVDLSVKGDSYKEKSLEILMEKFGLKSLGETNPVIVVETTTRPESDESGGLGTNVPDGSFVDQRQVQFGEVLNPNNGEQYRFFNDRPIRDLREGDMIECIVLTKGRKGRKGYAFLLG
ncbi:tetratricopeptide repeat protein [Roseivirga echinicomitans]|uniref:Tetratricopeptide repeat protein n=1 Tax=Roseivirga echinicomitans TaxID=296218 RepID=A0A150XXN3_9BACT|nr:tetratricopeptide repeat protein [Roseivirga echinicomitans]KYG83404.1 hypothetical protein AWN68_00960 [Roseivirga echinicomitans]